MDALISPIYFKGFLMLGFMRKHQKYFFVVITFVIVISFSFFGTYSTLAGNSIHEQTAFTTVNGQAVPRQDLEEMAMFIGTDTEDKKLFGGVWGPNFLNDGLIKKDFLETGLAEILIESYKQDLKGDWQLRLQKEGRFKPYVHPQAQFVSSANAWNYFSPELPGNLATLQKATNPLSQDAVNARIQLFLAERRFPSPYLKQVLRYQESQLNWIEKDTSLDYQDLSLFGYHTVDDWFGGRFVRLISEFIFNAAAIAEQKGYTVSKDEALADLMRNSEISFKENRANPQNTVANSTEYFDQQLMRMRMDKTKVARIWQKVMLFRRLFQDEASAVFVDPVAYSSFNQFANTGVSGDIYRLPEELRFSDFKTMQRFETYLDLVSKRTKEEKNSLLAPKEFLTVAEISKKAPELVQKHYQLEVASVNKKDLQAKVSLKETLAWELDEKNWTKLKTQFPELGVQKVATSNERLDAIEKLDGMTRSRLDQFAREQIIAAHPEYLDSALENAPSLAVHVNLSLRGANNTFDGLVQGNDLITLLDKAPLNEDVPELKKLSFDKEHYYKVKVLEKSPELEILTFAEANKGNALDSLIDQNLEIAYVQLRTEDPATYQNADKSWKPYDQVKDKVALAYYKNTLDKIKDQLKVRSDKDKYQNLDGERLASYRFVAWGEDLLKKFKKAPENAEKMTRPADAPATFSNQFNWTKATQKISKKSTAQLPGSEKILGLGANDWSDTILFPNGDLYFAFITGGINEEGSDEVLQNQVGRARFLLGSDVQRTYLRSIIPFLKESRAISFDYMYSGEPSVEPQEA
jgi:GcvH upstream region-like protein